MAFEFYTFISHSTFWSCLCYFVQQHSFFCFTTCYNDVKHSIKKDYNTVSPKVFAVLGITKFKTSFSSKL